ncbi:MAG: peptidylprolyl isomerase [Puniceicoccales bacterium]|jgi:FKBP-type peptidyl-prolyl cis-trans isomerase SlyD|nr:peptidylprolyl isomerase [Puniceicoccales bacterium]
MKIAPKTVVAIDYTLTDPKGDVLDSSLGREPLEYLHGAANIIPGLERALEGLAAGDAKIVVVAPADGYGVRDPKLVVEVPRDRFPAEAAVEPGMKFHAQLSDGQMHVVTVGAVKDDSVVLDANHELAGVELRFDVKVRGVRAATEEEVAHGHPHHGHQCCGGHGHGHGHCGDHGH